MTQTIHIDDLQFEVKYSPRRKHVELSVEREGGLVIRAPEGTDPRRLESAVREKRFWLYTKMAEKETLRRSVPTKEYVSGEGFPYLGRNYRLLLVGKDQTRPLKLEQGRFKMVRAEATHGREHFVAWYSEHAKPWLTKRVDKLAPRVGVEPSGVEVRDLGYRWGSCGARGVLNFHWATILLPPSIVEYVVVHELVHLRQANHTPEFWKGVERAMPDFEARKQWLAENGAEYVAV
jgi:predicted metal-dependent hydrolase